MTHRHNLEAVNCTLRGIFRSTFPFAKIVLLCIENFRQILPVLRAANRSQSASAYYKRPRIFLALSVYNPTNMCY